VGKLAGPLKISTNNEVEVQALILGVRLCRDLKIRNLEIEGDSMIVINGLRSKRLVNWKLQAKFDKALSLLEGFDRVTFNHILREGNQEADRLSNIGQMGSQLEKSFM